MPNRKDALWAKQQRHYCRGQHIGVENRVTEFKLGRGKTRHVSRMVGLYTCAFLNTEGGDLYIGVDDNGIVQGITCNQRREDQLRQSIDGIIKGMKPEVFPDMYQVDFVPVYNQSGAHVLRDIKVILVQVVLSQCSRLFECKGQVYMRREGSIQRLAPHQIQAWVERKVKEDYRNNSLGTEEGRRMDGDSSVKLQQDQDESLHEQVMKLKQKEEEQESLHSDSSDDLEEDGDLGHDFSNYNTDLRLLPKMMNSIDEKLVEIERRLEAFQNNQKGSKVCIIL
ncbi:schlafen-like protein 1 isoform X2 [Lingula anatina]|uniref:Schlafen-like protein 1 isoform X2 n=1 Tax=Lingula anatina TaxID=7574 RepID=A0A1S3H786_LINAN|nr:schlafen-like protein 1 isoform X2 [Lingula anatina]|eukprot:XP_013381863.1 schlafen-like protein 1 isoform X2 [Lingula anatina]